MPDGDMAAQVASKVALERALIGSVLVAPHQYDEVRTMLTEADFTSAMCADAWRAFAELDEVDLVLTAASMTRLDVPGREHIDVTSWLAETMTDPGLLAVKYAHAILESNARIELAKALEWIKTPAELEAYLASAERKAVGMTPVGEMLELEAVPETGLTTGILDLDALIGELPRGLVVVGGRPGEGKSALVLQIALRAAQQGVVRYYNYEMSWRDLVARMLSQQTGIPVNQILGVRLDTFDWRQIHNAQAELSERMLFAAEGRIDGYRSKLVVVDYLQLVPTPARLAKATREAQVAATSRHLLSVATRHDTTVLAAAQLHRTRAQPELYDLRESGQIEQDASLVLLLYSDDSEPKRHWIKIAKNRHGAVGVVEVAFRGLQVSFADIARGRHWWSA